MQDIESGEYHASGGVVEQKARDELRRMISDGVDQAGEEVLHQEEQADMKTTAESKREATEAGIVETIGRSSMASRTSFTSSDGDDLLCEIWQQRHRGDEHAAAAAATSSCSGTIAAAAAPTSSSSTPREETKETKIWCQHEEGPCESLRYPAKLKDDDSSIMKEGDVHPPSTEAIPRRMSGNSITRTKNICMGTEAAISADAPSDAVTTDRVPSSDATSLRATPSMCCSVRSTSTPGAYHVRPSVMMTGICDGNELRGGEYDSEAFISDADNSVGVTAESNHCKPSNRTSLVYGNDGTFVGDRTSNSESLADYDYGSMVAQDPLTLTLQATKVDDLERTASADADLVAKMQQRILELEAENRSIVASKGIEVATIVVPVSARKDKDKENTRKKREKMIVAKPKPFPDHEPKYLSSPPRDRNGRRVSTEQMATAMSKTACEFSSSKMFVLSSIFGLVGIVLTIVIIKVAAS